MTEATFVVRKALAMDMPATATLAAQMVRMHHAWDPRRFMLIREPIEEGYEHWLRREMENPRALVLVAVPRSEANPGQVLGYAYARLEPRDWNRLMDACGILHDLVVAEAWRRWGVASALIELVARWMADHQAPRLLLETAVMNAAAQAFFRKHGFRPTMMEMAREI